MQPLSNFFFSGFHPKVDPPGLAHPGHAWIAARSGSALCSVVLLDVTGAFLRNTTVLKTQFIACLQMTVMYPSSLFYYKLRKVYSSSMIACVSSVYRVLSPQLYCENVVSVCF